MRSARTAAASARSVTVASVAALAASAAAARNRRLSSTQHAPAPTSDPGEQEQGGNGVHARRVPGRTDRTGRGTPGGTVNGAGESPNGRTCGRSRGLSARRTRGPAATASPAAPNGTRPVTRRCAAPGGTARTAPPALRAHADAAARTAAGRPAFAAYSV